MALTDKRIKFCQEIVSGKSQHAAYVSAFNTANQKDTTITNNAYKLMQNNDVITTIEQLRNELAAKCLWTREQSISVLSKVISEDGGTVAVSAVKELNAMHGYNAPQKIEHSGGMINKIEIEIVNSKA